MDPLAPLRPIAPDAPGDPEIGLLLLEGNLRMVGALCGRAIAGAWDSGRLGRAAASDLPFAAEVEAMLGAAGGLAPKALERADQRLAITREALRTVMARVGTGPLGRLAEELELSRTATKILWIVAGPALQPE